MIDGVRTPVAEPGFVGRRRELEALTTALRSADEGSGSLVAVHGEAGIGKTRTVAEFARKARRAGSVVLWGTCYEGVAVRSFGPWAEALGGYLGTLECGRAAELLGRNGPILAELVPGLRSELADAPAPAGLPPAEARVRLFEAVVSLLDSMPALPVLVLDDVQWADADALDLLTHVARHASRLLIVVTYLGSALDLVQPLAVRLAEIGRRRPSEYLRLESLSRPEATELVEEVAGAALEGWLIDTMYEESGGNPFFLGELGRHVSRHGPPAVSGGSGAWRVPEGLRQAVALRLTGISAQTREVLDYASVFTAGFGFNELQRLTELDHDLLLDALEEALAAELIRPVGADQYDFAHAVVRHVLSERFSPSQRARLHQRAAEILESTLTTTPEREAELARQYHASTPLPRAQRGIPHALLAAREARAAHAPREALTLLGLARELVSAEDTATRAEIEAEVAVAQAEAGMADAAPLTLESALALLQAGGAPGEALADLVFTVMSAIQDTFAGPSELHEALIARGLAALGETHTIAWARLSLLKRPFEAVSSGPIHALRWRRFNPAAVAIARTEGSENDYARTLDPAEPWPVGALDELVARVETWQIPAAKARGMAVALIYLTLQHGTTPVAERVSHELKAVADELSSIVGQALAKAGNAAILGASGDFPAALAATAEARRSAERTPATSVGWILRFIDLVAELTAMQVEADWARRGEHMRRLSITGPPWWRFLYAAIAAQSFARAQMPDAAREQLDHVLPVLAAGEPDSYTQNGSVAFAAEAVWELRDAELAEQLLPAGLALVHAAAGDWYMTSNELTVARLATVVGRIDQAREFFDGARATLGERGQRPLCAIVDHDEALALRSGRQPEAARLMADANARFAELGMHAWYQETAPTQRGRATTPDGLTAREAQILKLLSAGKTNKDMAGELVISVHTVERHLQNAYRKVGVRNRADAAAYAVRTGL